MEETVEHAAEFMSIEDIDTAKVSAHVVVAG